MKIDCHIHTCHSYDSIMQPAKILMTAKKRGLHGIVVCDHNTIRGGLEAYNLNHDPEFHVIVGAEMATDAGDVTGIFLTREIKSRNFTEVALEIKKQGGKVILNHPYKQHDLSKVDFSLVDYIEAYNARLAPMENEKALQLAQKHGIPVLAGSDAHLYAEIGHGITEVDSLETFHLVSASCQYTPKKFTIVSQYIKALKQRKIRIFWVTTKVAIKQLKKSLKTNR